MRQVLRALVQDRMGLVGLVLILLLVACAVFAPVLAPYPEDLYKLTPSIRLRPPGWEHLFGTDRMGADLFSRVLFGARITVVIALVAVGTALVVGVPLGLLAGWFDHWAAELIQRLADVFLAIPQIILAIAIAQTLGPSIPNVILALSATLWPWFTRLVAAETRTLRNEVFVEASLALGVRPWRVVLGHVVPNIASPLLVRTTLSMGFTILTAAALGFLGLGAQPPAPEWGRTIAEARQYLPNAWWYAAAPGLAIFVVVLGFNLLGDGLRDALDPRLRRGLTRRG